MQFIIMPLVGEYPSDPTGRTFAVPDAIFLPKYLRRLHADGLGMYLALLCWAQAAIPQEMSLEVFAASGRVTQGAALRILDRIIKAGLLRIEDAGEQRLRLVIRLPADREEGDDVCQ